MKCSLCNLDKPPEAFVKRNDRVRGYHNWCRECQKNHWSKWSKTLYGQYKIYKQRANTRKVSFELSLEEFEIILRPKRCSYCGVTENELAQHPEWAMGRHNLSLDRIDNSIGYVTHNVVLSCMRCNFIKSDFFSFDEMKKIAEQFITPKLKA